MRKLIGLGVVLGSAVAVWACSSSSSGSPATTGDDTNEAGSSSGASSGGSSGGSDAATASCSESEVTGLAGMYGYDGGAGDGAVPPCVMTNCSTELSACSSESCTSCGEALGTCFLDKCTGFADASLTVLDSSATCDAPGPQCAALATCCMEAQDFSAIVPQIATLATTCTANSKSCDEEGCKATAMQINSFAATLAPNGVCPIPDGG